MLLRHAAAAENGTLLEPKFRCPNIFTHETSIFIPCKKYFVRLIFVASCRCRSVLAPKRFIIRDLPTKSWQNSPWVSINDILVTENFCRLCYYDIIAFTNSHTKKAIWHYVQGSLRIGQGTMGVEVGATEKMTAHYIRV